VATIAAPDAPNPALAAQAAILARFPDEPPRIAKGPRLPRAMMRC
jgi:hypothetical protein